jgi:polar amino acid transport system permease protein
MTWSWQAVRELLPALLRGLETTLYITLVGSVIAIGVGLAFALLGRSGRSFVRGPVLAFEDFVRNTPILVQLIFVYYVALTNLGLSWLSAFSVGSTVLGLHFGSYMAVVYRAGIDGVPKGQWEATTALSLPQRQTWTHVILPQAIPKVLPALGNYVISMFKETPQLIVIAVPELLAAAREYRAEHYAYDLEAFTLVGLMFLAVSLPAALLIRLLERHFARAA